VHSVNESAFYKSQPAICKTRTQSAFYQGAIKHGRWNGDSAPDLCVIRVPPPYTVIYNVNKNGIGMFMQKRAEKTKVKNAVFCTFLNNLMVWRHCWIHFLYIWWRKKGSGKIHHERNKNLKRNRADRMWAYSKYENFGMKWDIFFIMRRSRINIFTVRILWHCLATIFQ
jgi:hypothetical protein